MIRLDEEDVVDDDLTTLNTLAAQDAFSSSREKGKATYLESTTQIHEFLPRR